MCDVCVCCQGGLDAAFRSVVWLAWSFFFKIPGLRYVEHFYTKGHLSSSE